jgi:hypothetical protein
VTKAQGRELLAQRVIDGYKVACRKLRNIEGDIRALWAEFDKLDRSSGETIMGCSTKKEFCKRHIDRELRSVRYMLNGGNHKRAGETVSPSLDVFDAAYQYLSAFTSEENLGRLPALLDRLKVGPTLTVEEEKTLKAVLTQLEHLSEQAGAYRQQLSEYAPKAEAA